MNNNENFIGLTNASMSTAYAQQVQVSTSTVVSEYPGDRQDYCYWVAGDHFGRIYDAESRLEEGNDYEQFFADVWPHQLRNLLRKDSNLSPSWLLERH